jgi:hypothetical protein
MSTRDWLLSAAFALLAIAGSVSVPDFRLNTFAVVLGVTGVCCLIAGIALAMKEANYSPVDGLKRGLLQLGLSKVRPLALRLEVVSTDDGLSLHITNYDSSTFRDADVLITNLLWWNETQRAYVEVSETHSDGAFPELNLTKYKKITLTHGDHADVPFVAYVGDSAVAVRREEPSWMCSYSPEKGPSYYLREGIWKVFWRITDGERHFEGEVCLEYKGRYMGKTQPIACPIEGNGPTA